MKEIILGVWLGIQGAIDWRYKEIPLWLSVLGGVIGIYFCFIDGRGIEEIVLSCIPGLLALVISKLTKEVMGYGDGITFLVMGFYISLENLISIGMLAFVIAGITALILLVIFRKGGRYRMPFLPFLAASYYISIWAGKGGF